MEFLLEVLVCLQSVWLVVLCPYTKVEESFNLQAIHDLLYHGRDLEKYDHHEFPGVVPRTFLGPITVSAIVYPFKLISSALGQSKLLSLYTVRIILGLIVMTTFVAFSRAVRTKFGTITSRFLCIITIVQFHFLFYSSRPLPNTFALALVLLAMRYWLLQNHALFIWMAGASIILFRFELAIFFGLILIQELVRGQLTVIKFLFHTIPAGVSCLCLTVFIDSYFWGRWLWPEGEVLWYNTILNKSSQWGTSPIWWYFTSALPRSLLLPLFMIPWGVLRERRTIPLLVTAAGFVSVYSLLPHKELRFIMYSIPLFNTVAASGYSQIWKNRNKYSLFVPIGLICSLLLSCGMSIIFFSTSINNYPGGHALRALHRITENNHDDRPYSVHIGVEAAMTGVSRFGETQTNWNYSKKEGLQPASAEMMEYDFLLISVADYSHYNTTHDVIHKQSGFSRISLQLKSFPPINILVEDKIYVLKKVGKFKQK